VFVPGQGPCLKKERGVHWGSYSNRGVDGEDVLAALSIAARDIPFTPLRIGRSDLGLETHQIPSSFFHSVGTQCKPQ
jgi:hypothetical protein